VGIIIRQSILSSAYTYVGTVIGAFSILFVFPLFLSPQEFGAFRLIIELGALLSGFGLLGIGQSIIRFYPYFREGNTSNGFMFLVLLLSFMGSILMGSLYFVFRSEIFEWFGKEKGYISEIFLPIFLVGLFRIFQTVFENIAANHGKITSNNFFREILTRINLLIVVGFYYYGFLDFGQLCLLVSLVFAVNAILNFVFVILKLDLDFNPNWSFLKKNKNLRKDMLQFNMWLILSSISLLIIQKIDFFMLGGTKGMLDTAVYSIGFYLAVLVEIPKRSIQQVSAPIVSKHLKEENHVELEKLYKQSANNSLFSAILVFLGILSVTSLFYHIMPKGEIYKASIGVLYFVGIAKIIESWGVTAVSILSNSRFYFYGLITAMLNIFLAVYLNFWLIPIYGINGAAFATLVTISINIFISVGMVYLKFGFLPISRGQLFSMCYLFLVLCLFLITHGIANIWIRSAIDLSLVLTLGFVAIRYFRVSIEMAELLTKFLNKFNLIGK
jgi:O-antigen/teichoic acid export membrane protein